MVGGEGRVKVKLRMRRRQDDMKTVNTDAMQTNQPLANRIRLSSSA